MPAVLTNDVRRLETLQATVTEGALATIERNELAFSLWRNGMTQREIAETLDRVDRRSGGEGVTHAMVAKMIARMRVVREPEMLAAAMSG